MLRLVIADDERYTRDCIVDFMDWSQHGIEIVGLASDGPEAYQVITETKPDIAILDIQMPGMNGLEVIEALSSGGCDTVFIIVSSFDNFEYARRAIHLGVEEYLLKPFLPDEFLAAIYKSAERIRYLRGMAPPPAPAPVARGETPFFGGPHLSLTSDVVYPVREERALMESLQVDAEEAVVLSRVDAFARCVAEANTDLKKQASCFLILYVSLYRFSSLHGISLSQEFSGAADSAEQAAFNRRLQDFLRQTCSTLHQALLQQKSGSYLVKRAMEYIRQHYSEELSLEVIAKSIYISPSYLSSLFRQNIGKTYIEYLNSFRVSMAKEIMREEPHLKNYEIAAKLGYSPKYLAQIFKQLEGVTLSDFRQSLPVPPLQEEKP